LLTFLVSRAPTIKEIKFFEQKQRSRELEKELKATLIFKRKTTTSTTKLVPHVIVISDSKEKVEIKPQLVVEEQPQLVPIPRPMEEKEL
jgi:uncharacterized protein affecting Mg2+/Co2+ transport